MISGSMVLANFSTAPRLVYEFLPPPHPQRVVCDNGMMKPQLGSDEAITSHEGSWLLHSQLLFWVLETYKGTP